MHKEMFVIRIFDNADMEANDSMAALEAECV